MQKPHIVFLIAALLLSVQYAAAMEQQHTLHTRSGKTLIVSETHSMGASLSDIRVRSQGFQFELDETIHDSDPLGGVVMGDLDEDGFDEIYLTTVSAGSGSYGSILAYASNRDRSLSMINFPAIRDGDDRFAGYRGHDTFSFRTHRLLRTFPVYLEGDTNHQATGGQRVVIYELVPGEAMRQLVIVGSEQSN